MTRLRQLWALLSPPTRIRLVLAAAASVALAILEIGALLTVLPLMQLATGAEPTSGALGLISDVMGTSDSRTLLLATVVVMVSAFAVKAAAAMWSKWWILGFVYDEEAALSVELLRHYTRAPYMFHRQHSSAILLRTMIESVASIFTYIVVGAVSVLSETTFLVISFVALIFAAPVPTLELCVYVAVFAVAYLRFQKARSRSYGAALRDGSLAIYQSGTQVLGGIRDVLLRNSPEYLIAEYSRARERFTWARRRAAFVAEVPRHVLEVIFISGLAILTLTLLTTAPSDQALPTLAFIVAAGFRILPSAARLLSGLNSIRIGLPSFDQVRADLGADWTRGRVVGDVSPMPLDRELKIDAISFSFPDGGRVLSDINLSIPAGSSIALVGHSGAGKTTLADIVMGLQTPSSGSILVDGVDVNLSLPGWQKSIGMVSQDVFLMDASLAANVAFGVEPTTIDQAAMDDAIRMAHLADVVAALPDGLDTHVGERGSRLSGGQRQRVGIARALYLRPSLLVLDEATSALDTETEARISDTLEDLRGQLTVLVVAHRLSTVRKCDQVAYLEAGRLVAAGSFDEVVAASPAFARMVRLGSLTDATR